MEQIPLAILILDYVLGLAMWTLIGRFGMSLFVAENSDFFFMKAFVRMTDPMIRFMHRVTPSFLIEKMRPLYVAWFIYMIRFYVMPLILGYSVMGMLSFPLESEIAVAIYNIGSIFN